MTQSTLTLIPKFRLRALACSLTLLALMALALPSFAKPRHEWSYSVPRSSPDMHHGGIQIVADRTGGVVALFGNNLDNRKWVIWLSPKGRVIFQKELHGDAEIFSAERNAFYLRGRFVADQVDPSVLVVSRKREETELESMEYPGFLYFDNNGAFVVGVPLSKPTDSGGFFAFSASEDPENPTSPPLLKIVRHAVR